MNLAKSILAILASLRKKERMVVWDSPVDSDWEPDYNMIGVGIA